MNVGFLGTHVANGVITLHATVDASEVNPGNAGVLGFTADSYSGSTINANTLPDHQLIVFARDDDYFFGVLQSRVHEVWARRQGTQLREVESGFRYTPTTTFETFPFPWPPGREPADDPRVEAIAEAARELVEKRDRWPMARFLFPSDSLAICTRQAVEQLCSPQRWVQKPRILL